MARTMANIVSMLMENPKNPRTAKVPERYHRHCDGRDQCGSQTSQKNIHDHEDQQDGLKKRLYHLVYGQLDKRCRLVGISDLHSQEGSIGSSH